MARHEKSCSYGEGVGEAEKCCAYVMNVTAGALEKDCPVE